MTFTENTNISSCYPLSKGCHMWKICHHHNKIRVFLLFIPNDLKFKVQIHIIIMQNIYNIITYNKLLNSCFSYVMFSLKFVNNVSFLSVMSDRLEYTVSDILAWSQLKLSLQKFYDCYQMSWSVKQYSNQLQKLKIS